MSKDNISILRSLLKISAPKGKMLYLLKVISLRALNYLFGQNASFK